MQAAYQFFHSLWKLFRRKDLRCGDRTTPRARILTEGGDRFFVQEVVPHTMRALIPAFLFAFAGQALAVEQTVLVRVTTYWRSEGCGLRASWNGARLRNGHCAVDPRKIPYGSKVLFPDAECTAVD